MRVEVPPLIDTRVRVPLVYVELLLLGILLVRCSALDWTVALTREITHS